MIGRSGDRSNTGPAGGRPHIALIGASAAVVLVVALLVVRFVIGGGGSVDAPTGVSVSANGVVVKIAWTGVDGADSYEVVRDGSAVVYSGSDTAVSDKTATEGKHTYIVRAISDGVTSAPSSSGDVTVGPSWGEYSPLVALLPKLLPQTPDTTGWNDINCSWLLSGFDDEMGPADQGSGKIYARARMACAGPTTLLALAWLVSKDATDSVFAAASRKPGAQAIRWRFGTGYLDERNGVAYLRPDTLENVWLAVGAQGAKKDQILALANQLPLE